MLRSSGGALNAAALSVPDQAIAPKQLLSIFGTNLNAPGAFIQATVADYDVEGLLPTSLGKLSFEFKTPNDPNVRLGRMIFVGENQANLQVPDFPPNAADTIQIQAVINRNGGQSEVAATRSTSTWRATRRACLPLATTPMVSPQAKGPRRQ
ncbi:MAG: hypothetical protein R2724_04610 [Bryobacterales bacterium]